MKREMDHWDELARKLRELIALIPNERMDEIYQKLYAEGYNKNPLKFPLSNRTRNPEDEIRYAILEAVAFETVERRDGRLPKQSEEPMCRKCPTSPCEPDIKPRGYCSGCAS
jgi:hypothetical protein